MKISSKGVSQTTFFLCVFDKIDTINKMELS